MWPVGQCADRIKILNENEKLQFSLQVSTMVIISQNLTLTLIHIFCWNLQTFTSHLTLELQGTENLPFN